MLVQIYLLLNSFTDNFAGWIGKEVLQLANLFLNEESIKRNKKIIKTKVISLFPFLTFERRFARKE